MYYYDSLQTSQAQRKLNLCFVGSPSAVVPLARRGQETTTLASTTTSTQETPGNDKRNNGHLTAMERDLLKQALQLLTAN